LSAECIGSSARIGSSGRIRNSVLFPSSQFSHPSVYTGTVKKRGSIWKPKPRFVWVL